MDRIDLAEDKYTVYTILRQYIKSKVSTGYVAGVDEIQVHPKYSWEVPSGKACRFLKQRLLKMSVFVNVCQPYH